MVVQNYFCFRKTAFLRTLFWSKMILIFDYSLKLIIKNIGLLQRAKFHKPFKIFEAKLCRRKFINGIKCGIRRLNEFDIMHLVMLQENPNVSTVCTVYSHVLFVFVFSIINRLAIAHDFYFREARTMIEISY